MFVTLAIQCISVQQAWPMRDQPNPPIVENFDKCPLSAELGRLIRKFLVFSGLITIKY